MQCKFCGQKIEFCEIYRECCKKGVSLNVKDAKNQVEELKSEHVEPEVIRVEYPKCCNNIQRLVKL